MEYSTVSFSASLSRERHATTHATHHRVAICIPGVPDRVFQIAAFRQLLYSAAHAPIYHPLPPNLQVCRLPSILFHHSAGATFLVSVAFGPLSHKKGETRKYKPSNGEEKSKAAISQQRNELSPDVSQPAALLRSRHVGIIYFGGDSRAYCYIDKGTRTGTDDASAKICKARPTMT
jgi:hypothetical protein